MQQEGERVLQNEDKIRKVRLFCATKAVFAIARELTERYNAFKKQHSRLDYEDLILITRNLLADEAAASWVLFKLDGGIDHILIDEAQDTSPNQWEIVKSLSAEFFAGAGSSEKNARFLPWATANSLFTAFRALIRINLILCQSFLPSVPEMISAR